jgi:hypothetical protein
VFFLIWVLSHFHRICIFVVPALGKTIQSFREGNRQRWLMKATDPLRQGGALVLDADGNVVLLHRDAYAGDHCDVKILAQAVKDALKLEVKKQLEA